MWLAPMSDSSRSPQAVAEVATVDDELAEAKRQLGTSTLRWTMFTAAC